MRRTIWAALAAMLVACSGTPDEVGVDAPEVGGADTVDTVDATVALDVRDDAAADLPGELPGPADVLEETLAGCQANEGCFLDPCEENTDCQSGFCLQHLGDAVCSQLCVEECPPGWVCKAVGGAGPDLVYACVSKVANLCRPCATGADCKSPGGSEDVCVSYGASGSFCGGACEVDDDCPWGFACREEESVEGVTSLQCVAEAGSCPCTARSVQLGLSTPCDVANEFGLCTGKRLCTEDGLTACDAAVPVQEVCNGIDDDCDGETDEETCDDGNECTEDTCLGEAGCEFAALEAGECKDGNPCTVADHCEAGVCVGSPVECDDSNPCTDDSCDETGGCLFAPNVLPCDDGEVCTLGDTCADGVCTGIAVDCECHEDADCAALEDGDVCNGTLVCDTSKLPRLCVVAEGSTVSCPEPEGMDAPCLAPACDPVTGDCSFVPAHDGWACNDGDACTLNDACMDGVCAAGAAAVCDDGNPCTDDVCGADGACVHTANQAVCDDHNACTTGDHCEAGACQSTGLLACDDGDVCTTDACAPEGGCFYTLNQAPCDDADVCTTGDHCHLGECISSGTLTCDDANPCTDDSCHSLSGCTFVANAAACDDGNLCTTVDGCSEGVCVGKAPLPCGDDNVCTDDSCAPAVGCVHTNNMAVCDDGDVCTLKDVCADGICLGGQALACDDSNPCTADGCDPETGCTHALSDGPCDDGNACTVGDACDNGMCIPGPAVDCDDGNECTADTCVPATGCQHENVPDQTACNGGGNWACVGGTCTCQPQCSGKECGDDACGGSCGVCGEDETCNGNTGQCVPSGGVVFGPYTWFLGPRGGNCLGVCEAHGLSCANIVASGWTESCGNTVCDKFFPGLPCSNDGDGPRLSSAGADGMPSGASKCICHDHNWGGWSCAWQQRPDDVRICPCH